jgi:uncharacterized protein YxjI
MLFDRKHFLVKERVALLKLTDTYDIFDPNSGAQVGIAHDEPGAFSKLLRLMVNKRLLATTINIYESESQPPVLSLHKKPGLFRITVEVRNGAGEYVGSFQSKLFSWTGGFLIFDASKVQIADLKGDWKGWNFRVLDPGGQELGVVTKKWAGLGKELFTSADNYMISMSEAGVAQDVSSALLLAAGLAIDILFKEH